MDIIPDEHTVNAHIKWLPTLWHAPYPFKTDLSITCIFLNGTWWCWGYRWQHNAIATAYWYCYGTVASYSAAQTQLNKWVRVTQLTCNITQVSNVSMCKHTWAMHCLHVSWNLWVLNSRMLVSTRKQTCEYLQMNLWAHRQQFLWVSHAIILISSGVRAGWLFEVSPDYMLVGETRCHALSQGILCVRDCIL